MKKTMVLLAATLGFSAHADLSVWDQMKHSSLNRVQGKVMGLEVQARSIEVTLSQDGTTKTVQVSTDTANNDCYNPYFTDEERVAFLNQKVDMLRESLRSGGAIEIGISGPFNSCLSSVSQLRNAKI